MYRVVLSSIFLFNSALIFAQTSTDQPKQISADLVIYGGTSAGVIAAVQAKKMGKSVVIVGPDKHLGGLSSGGLGWTAVSYTHLTLPTILLV